MADETEIILPEGFRRVEYLQSSGTQYITTDYYPEAGQKYISMDIEFIKISTQWSGNKHLFYASEYGNPDGAYDILYGCALNFGGANNQQYEHFFWVGGDRDDNNSICSAKWAADTVLNRNTLEIKGNTCTYGSQTVDIINGGTRAGTTPLTIFGAPNKPIGCYAMCLYEFKMGTFEDDQVSVSLHLIPCLDTDGVPCMYDLVEGKAYYNAGTGQFNYPKNYNENTPYELPAGYIKCAYLQSNGTQWINTGHIPNADTGVYLKAQHLSYGDFIPFGSWENSSSYYYPLRFNTNSKANVYSFGTTYQLSFYYDRSDDLIFTSTMNLYNDRTVNFWSEDTNWFDIIPVDFTTTFTRPLWLFSYNMDDMAINATYGAFGGRIFRAKITQGEALIHDYVPCLDDSGRPCMYDLIEQTPLYNQSSGEEFQYAIEHQLPSDFFKLKYLEDTGIQFIDTGVIPTNETGLYVDAQQITHTSGHAMGSGLDTSSNGFGVPRFLKGTANSCGFMWKTWNSYGNIGCGTRFEGYLNLYNDRTATLKTAGTTEKNNTLGELGFTPTVSIYMFKSNHSTLREWKGRIYRAKITQGTELIRDFVPAYDTRSSKPCMYDLINNVAYYNDGTGEFLYNRDFEGTYTGYGVMGGIGNRLGYIQEESGDDI